MTLDEKLSLLLEEKPDTNKSDENIVEEQPEEIPNPEYPEEEIEPTTEELLNLIQSGELTLDDIEMMHTNGEISDEVYNEVATTVMQADQMEQAEPEEEEIPEEEQVPQEEVPVEEPVTQPEPIVGKFQLVKLYNKFIDLKRFVMVYIDAYNKIETDELSKFQLERISVLYKNILKLRDDLNFYIINNFQNEEYKKNLYSYMLFNKEFAEQLKRFRHVLALDPNELVKEQNEKSENKDK